MATAAAVCRMCLSENVKMHNITNSGLEEIFEKLTNDQISAPGRPETFCYICCSQLQRCRQFLDTFQESDTILNDLALSRIQLTPDTISILDRKLPRRYIKTPIEFTNVPNLSEVSEDPVKNEVAVKQEPEDCKLEIDEDEIEDAVTAKKLKFEENEDPTSKTFACESCEKSYETKKQLDGHKRVHKQKQRKSRK